MKYFELKNERVLVLCPKKLRDKSTVHNGHLRNYEVLWFGLRSNAAGIVWAVRVYGEASRVF